MIKSKTYLCLMKYNLDVNSYYDNPENFINNIKDNKIKEELLISKKLDDIISWDW